jgi:hypothetical protein
MRPTALALSVTLAILVISVPAVAQEPSGAPAGSSTAPSQPGPSASSARDDGVLNLPVSLDRIREGLAQPAPAEPLKGLNDPPPTFKVEITEQQKFDDLLSKLKFDKGGPQVPGGIDAYEQYQRAFPRINNPLAQPYAAFSTGEILTLSIEALIEKYLAQKVGHVVGDALRARAEREAREEVARSLAQFWASQPPPPAAAPPKE